MTRKETESFHQSRRSNRHRKSSKTPQTIRMSWMFAPRRRKVKFKDFWYDLGLPIKWAIVILVPLFILILLGAGLFNLAKSLILYSQCVPNQSLAKNQPAVKLTADEQSIITPSAASEQKIVSSDKNNCTNLPTRMTTSKITARQVDKLFYQTYPDRVNKPLTTNKITERNLRLEWCSIANKLIEQKSIK